MTSNVLLIAVVCLGPALLVIAAVGSRIRPRWFAWLGDSPFRNAWSLGVVVITVGVLVVLSQARLEVPITKLPPGVYVTTREFLIGEQQPDSQNYAYGFLLLTHRPSDQKTSERYEATCAAYVSRLELVARFRTVSPDYIIPTYWLLTQHLANADAPKCPALLKYYNYARAHFLAVRFGVSAIEGPVLVATPKGEQGGPFDPPGLTYDLSRYSNDDLSRALGIWTLEVGRSPEHWKDGFFLVRLREEVRNELQSTGKEVAAVILPVANAKGQSDQ